MTSALPWDSHKQHSGHAHNNLQSHRHNNACLLFRFSGTLSGQNLMIKYRFKSHTAPPGNSLFQMLRILHWSYLENTTAPSVLFHYVPPECKFSDQTPP